MKPILTGSMGTGIFTFMKTIVFMKVNIPYLDPMGYIFGFLSLPGIFPWGFWSFQRWRYVNTQWNWNGCGVYFMNFSGKLCIGFCHTL